MSSEFPVAVQLPEDGCYAQSTITDSKKKYKIVFAIDLCTTLSGYAYSFASNKDAVHVNKNWGQTQGFLLHKTPTCLLLKPDGQFEAFGFEATSRYNDLADEEAAEYYYFDRFKMKLRQQELSFWLASIVQNDYAAHARHFVSYPLCKKFDDP